MLARSHNLKISQLEEILLSGPQGLSDKALKKNKALYGDNQIVLDTSGGRWAILLRQIWQFFPVLLIVAGIISYLNGEVAQFSVIIAVLLINVLIGFIQENKAQISLDKLKRDYEQKVEVFRHGEKYIINANDLVAGDLVFLRVGNKVPADIRVVKSLGLKIDESALSGESVAKDKINTRLPKSTPLSDRKNMAYKGTVIVSGRGKGYVVATGSRTEFAKILKIASQLDEPSPLQKRVNRIGLILSLFAGAISGLIFLLGIVRLQMDVVVLLSFVIALLVSAVPESLPTVLLLILTKGVALLARSKAVVRKLPAVETLGSVDLIATDKTGTLTVNKLSLAKVVIWRSSKFTRFSLLKKNPLPIQKNNRTFQALVKVAVLNNNSEQIRGKWVGDPTEIALAQLGKIAGLDRRKLRSRYPRQLEQPFSSQTKYMLSVHQTQDGYLQTCKGAPEIIAEFCQLTQKQKKTILDKAKHFSRQGLRVLAFAIKKQKRIFKSKTPPRDFKFLGLVGLIDPIAPGVKEALARTGRAGIDTIIITGDHPETALAIGRKLGLASKKAQVMTGSQLTQLTSNGLKKELSRVRIFARVSPTDKARIVRAYMDMGKIVAVTGDGINDAPILKLANVGVAMGKRGTDIARDASDIVLLDDSFATIAKAVGYGRAIWANVKKAITFLLAGNFSEIFLVAIVFLFGASAPFTTAQILWINLVTDSFPALALAYDKVNPDLLDGKPSASQLNRLFGRAVFLGLIGLMTGGILFLIYLPGGIELARTIVFANIVIFELVILFSIRARRSVFRSPVTPSIVFAVLLSLSLLLLAIYSPLNIFLGAVALSVSHWIMIITFSTVSLIIAEATKGEGE